jgi:hypothetical protein
LKKLPDLGMIEPKNLKLPIHFFPEFAFVIVVVVRLMYDSLLQLFVIN